MALFSLPENCKVITAIPAQVGAAGTVQSDYISVKNYQRVYIVIDYSTAGNAETFAPMRATAVDGTGSVVLTTVCRIWSNLATATSDTLVERTAAVNYACDNAATDKLIIFEVDTISLGDGYDVLSLLTTAIAAGDYISALFICVPRYQSRVLTQPSGITD